MLEPAARSTFLTDAHLFDGRRGRPNALLWHSLTSWRPTAGPQHARRGSGDEKRQPKRAVAARATPCERTAAVPFGQRHRTRRPSASAPARPPPRPARHVVRFLAYLRFADAAGPLPHCIWKLARRLFRSASVAERHRAEQPTAALASVLLGFGSLAVYFISPPQTGSAASFCFALVAAVVALTPASCRGLPSYPLMAGLQVAETGRAEGEPGGTLDRRRLRACGLRLVCCR